MTLFDKAQQVVDATPLPVSLTVMLGSLAMSILQPLALFVTLLWGCLQIHGYVKREWGWRWLMRVFKRKDK